MIKITKTISDYYIERIGQGENVLFLPAAGFSGDEGLNIAENLKDKYRTHLIDLPGIGKSKGIEGRITSIELAGWVNEYMEKMQIEKADLIGHSLGGAILLTFAVHYPEKVNKLILLDQGHKPIPRIPRAEFGAFAYVFPLLNVCVKLFGDPFLRKLAPFFLKGNEQEDTIGPGIKQFCDRFGIIETEYVRTALRNSADFSVSGLKLLFGYYNLNLPELLKKVKVPTYLLYGTFEDLDEKECQSTVHYIDRLKKKKLPITYHAVAGGHYVHWNEEFPMSDLKGFLLND